MLRFSTIEFEDNMYCLPGKVDKYALQNHEELKELLMEYDKTESVTVWCTIYLLDDGSTVDRDALDSEMDDIELDFQDYIARNKLKLVKEIKVVMQGLLPEPFEDYYGLQGADRERYLRVKKEVEQEKQGIRKALAADGYTDDQIDIWFRVNYYNDNEE